MRRGGGFIGLSAPSDKIITQFTTRGKAVEQSKSPSLSFAAANGKRANQILSRQQKFQCRKRSFAWGIRSVIVDPIKTTNGAFIDRQKGIVH